MIQQELFKPEPPIDASEEMKFDLTLKDGSCVSAHFKRHYFSGISHIDFYGDAVSETGYRSYFPGGDCLINDSDDAVIEKAREVAEMLREDMVKKTSKRRSKKDAGEKNKNER